LHGSQKLVQEVRYLAWRFLGGGFRGDIEPGLVENVGVGMAPDERVAGVIFLDNGGRVEFEGLCGRSPAFLRWCSDLFLFYWNEASKVSFGMKR
jgi:hypothetical protein